MNQAHWFIRLARLGGVVMLIAAGLLITLLVYPLCEVSRRRALKARWSALLLKVLGMEVRAGGSHLSPGSLLVANHISWIDIFVINAVMPSAFVAKEEVRRWPLVGWLAEKNDTVFLRRGQRCHARAVNDEIEAILLAGRAVAVFPEGTTSDGSGVLPFHAALLQPALTAGHPVVPVALSYWEADGQRSDAPRYDGDISFGQCLLAIAGRKRLIASLQSSPPLGLHGGDRRTVAAAAQAAILQKITKAPASLANTARLDTDRAVVALLSDAETGEDHAQQIV